MKTEKHKHGMTPHEVVDFLINTVSTEATEPMFQYEVAERLGIKHKRNVSIVCSVLGIKTLGYGANGMKRMQYRRNVERDAQIMQWRREGKTLQWIADRLFITRERVRQVVKKFIEENGE